MGSIGNTARLGAFQNQAFPKGLDLRRSTISHDEGTYVTDPAGTIRAGQFAALNASQLAVPSAGAGTFGVFKWDKQQLGYSVRVDVPLVLSGTTAVFVGRANISNVAVRSLPDFAGTLYTGGGTDYNVVGAAGTVARDATTTIPDGATVYVSFTFALVASDFEFDGRTFRNQNNDMVTGQEDRVAIITDWSKLFTMEWASEVAYGYTSTFKLYCSSEGKATSTAGTDFVGRVFQLPVNDDQFMGIITHGNPVV